MNLLTLSAVAHGELLARGELSSEAMTTYYLARIAQLNPTYHALTFLAGRRALLAARAWDRSRRKGSRPGPLAGVPTAIKDLAMVRFMPARFGSSAFRNFVALRDDQSTSAMRKAGMIILGKLATSEFGAMPVTEPELHAPTQNACAPAYTAGGSSGGSGAAVGTGMLPIAHGSDGGGSIRIPAALNHLVGFKHSRGVGVHLTPPDKDLRLSVTGPLARTVGDAAAFMDLLTAWPMGLHAQLGAPLGRLRVALATSTHITETHPAHVAAAKRVAAILADAGAVVEERPWVNLTDADFFILWKRLMANIPVLAVSKLQPVTAWLRAEGKHISKAEASAKRVEMEATIGRWFGDYDLWISPTTAIVPPKHGEAYGATPQETFARVLGLGAYTAPFNVGGQPAISIPLGYLDEGPGIGVQIAGRVGQDALVLRAAKFVEDALGGFWPPSHLALG